MNAKLIGIVAEIGTTSLTMIWTWRNLSGFSTMTIKSIAQVLTKGIGIAIGAIVLVSIFVSIFSAVQSGDHSGAGLEDERDKMYELYATQLSSGIFGVAIVGVLIQMGWFNLSVNAGLIVLVYSGFTAVVASGILRMYLYR
tara:strand:+ start:267 stop:689 length:423 start_codon:yes stop_codon:yes gene_type:complete